MKELEVARYIIAKVWTRNLTNRVLFQGISPLAPGTSPLGWVIAGDLINKGMSLSFKSSWPLGRNSSMGQI